jgi:uncharacterized phage protein (TIGR01671 family)
MRTIKFRGKRVNRREWVYSTESFVQTDEGICMGLYNEEKDVIPDTVGQFTGLYDKNGKEIYEGDIMNNPTSENVGVIQWNSALCQFQLSWQNMLTAADIVFMVMCGSLVIGNIHDNPELLTNK